MERIASAPTQTKRWSIEIEGMPLFDESMKRVYAWFENEIIDRAPIRLQAHNAFLIAAAEEVAGFSKKEKKAWWFDVETQVGLFVRSVKGRRFHGETFYQRSAIAQNSRDRRSYTGRLRGFFERNESGRIIPLGSN